MLLPTLTPDGFPMLCTAPASRLICITFLAVNLLACNTILAANADDSSINVESNPAIASESVVELADEIELDEFAPTLPEDFFTPAQSGGIVELATPYRPQATWFNSEHHALVVRTSATYLDSPQTSYGGTLGTDLYFRLGNGWGSIGSMNGIFLDDGSAVAANGGIFRVPRWDGGGVLPRFAFAAMFDHFSENFIANSNASQVRLKLGYALKPDLTVGFNYAEPVGRSIGVIQNPAGGPLAVPIRMNQQFGGYLSGWIGDGVLNATTDFAYLRDIDAWSVGSNLRAPLTDRCTAFSNVNYADNGTWVANSGFEFSLGRRSCVSSRVKRCISPVTAGGIVRGDAPVNVGSQFAGGQPNIATSQQRINELEREIQVASGQLASIDSDIESAEERRGQNFGFEQAAQILLRELNERAKEAETEEERKEIASETKAVIGLGQSARSRLAGNDREIDELNTRRNQTFGRIAELNSQIAVLQQAPPVEVVEERSCLATLVSLTILRDSLAGRPAVSPNLTPADTAAEVNSVFGGPLGGAGMTEYLRYVNDAQNQAILARKQYQNRLARNNANANAVASGGAAANAQAGANANAVALGSAATNGQTGANPCGPGEYFVPGSGCIPCPTGTIPYDSDGDGVPDQCIFP